MTNTDMGDKRVLVTGAGTGIGRGVALAFAAAGARVALHYAHSAAGVNSAVEEIAGGGGFPRRGVARRGGYGPGPGPSVHAIDDLNY